MRRSQLGAGIDRAATKNCKRPDRRGDGEDPEGCIFLGGAEEPEIADLYHERGYREANRAVKPDQWGPHEPRACHPDDREE